MHLKPEDQERVAQAYLKDAGNKQLSAERGMKARGEAQRWKALCVISRRSQSHPCGPQFLLRAFRFTYGKLE
jgi:hypothetical protein